MKRIIGLLLLPLLIFSCQRKADHLWPPSLEGSWKMTAVKNQATGLFTTKPAGIPGEVEIIFAAVNGNKGIFSGKTPTNAFNGHYSTSEGRFITIPAVSASKVVETSWGLDFLMSITSALEYTFEAGDKLIITTPDYQLYFQRQ